MGMTKATSMARAAVLAIAVLIATVLNSGAASAATYPADPPPPVDDNNYWCFDGDSWICLFDGNGGPWGGSHTLEGDNAPEIDFRNPDPEADFSDRITSYTNNVDATYRFYDQPAGTQRWNLIFTVAPRTQGLFPPDADNRADLMVRNGEKANPCV